MNTNIDYGTGEKPPEKAGFSNNGIQKVIEIFESQQAGTERPGAQLVVLRHGQVALDRWMGLANRRRHQPMTATTSLLTFSTSKALTGMCVHKLLDEGKLHLDDPIARYWPEFGKGGKESATIRHAFLHQMGIPSTNNDVLRQLPLWPHWRLITAHIANLKAKYPPGTQTGYHAVNNGFVLGELVRRVTGRRIEDYLYEEFLQPLGMTHSWLGLPADQFQNSAQIYAGEEMDKSTVALFGMRFVRHAVLPAASLHSTARDLAVFYQMLINLGEYNGRRVIPARAVENAIQPGYEGLDGTFNAMMRWAYGFALGGLPKNGIHEMGLKSTNHTFGHYGMGSCMAWGDMERKIVAVYLSNTLHPGKVTDPRWQALSDAIFDACTD